MNPDLTRLHPYPFARLNTLLSDIHVPANQTPISLSIGEPKHAPPEFVLRCLQDSQSLVSIYPTTRGTDPLRQTISKWLTNRFKLHNIDFERHVLPVNGTREALFAINQCIADRSQSQKDLVLMPNPFYQIYEGATFLSGLTPSFYDLSSSTDYAPDFDAIDDVTWARCQMVYICTPGNPAGKVISEAALQKLINKANKFDFVIISDECYSEIYFDENKPPCGLLEAANNMGNTDYKRCLVFHSLSKRSNLPGMRSGFVAGDAEIIKNFLLYRTYHGSAMPAATQAASTLAWNDEKHVIENRKIYQKKFASVVNTLQDVLPVNVPEAAFYLWPKLPIDDETCARELYKKYAITVLPGSYLSREYNGINPGSHHIRIALVAEHQACVIAAQKIRTFIESL